MVEQMRLVLDVPANISGRRIQEAMYLLKAWKNTTFRLKVDVPEDVSAHDLQEAMLLLGQLRLVGTSKGAVYGCQDATNVVQFHTNTSGGCASSSAR